MSGVLIISVILLLAIIGIFIYLATGKFKCSSSTLLGKGPSPPPDPCVTDPVKLTAVELIIKGYLGNVATYVAEDINVNNYNIPTKNGYPASCYYVATTLGGCKIPGTLLQIYHDPEDPTHRRYVFAVIYSNPPPTMPVYLYAYVEVLPSSAGYP